MYSGSDLVILMIRTNAFKGLTRKQLLKLFAVLVVTDGYVHMKNKKPQSIRLETSNKSIGQHELFKWFSKKIFNKESKFYNKGKRLELKEAVTSELYSVDAITELLKLSKTYKTTPGKQTKESYLKGNQPSIEFLLNESDKAKWLALSVWLDFDGSISPCFKIKNKVDRKKNNTYRYQQIQFECEIRLAETNPNLTKQLVGLYHSLGIKVRIARDKRKWSNIDGVSVSSLASIRKILKNMRPITDVRVGRGGVNDGIQKTTIFDVVEKYIENNRLSYHFKSRENAIKHKRLLQRLFKQELIAPSSSGPEHNRG